MARNNPGNQRGGGALNSEPKPKGFQLGTDEARLKQQQEIFQKRIDKGAGANSKAAKNLQAVNSALGALNTDPGTSQPGTTPGGNNPDIYQGWNDVSGASNDFLKQAIGQMQGQGAFNPGDFTASRQKASDVAMNEFNRQNQGRFAQEDQEFQQRMADQGIDENSEKYRYMKGQFDLNRNNQVQGAQNNAFQAGQSEQSQAYGQAASTYNMPLGQINAMAPFYGYQAQANMQQGAQNWQSGQNEMDREFQKAGQLTGFEQQKEMARLQQKYAIQLQNNAPRGGGGGGGGGMPAPCAGQMLNGICCKGEWICDGTGSNMGCWCKTSDLDEKFDEAGNYIGPLHIEQVFATAGTTDQVLTVQSDKTIAAAAIVGVNVTKKTSDQSVTSSTTLVADSQLVVAVAANEIVSMIFNIRLTSSNIGGIRYRMTGPASPTSIQRFIRRWPAGAVAEDVTEMATAYDAADRAFATSAPAETRTYITEEISLTNGVNAGNVQFEFAQNVSDGTATISKDGSYVEVIRF